MSVREWYDEPGGPLYEARMDEMARSCGEPPSRAVVAAKRKLAMEARVDARLAGPPAPIVRLPKKAYGVIK